MSLQRTRCWCVAVIGVLHHARPTRRFLDPASTGLFRASARARVFAFACEWPHMVHASKVRANEMAGWRQKGQALPESIREAHSTQRAR